MNAYRTLGPCAYLFLVIVFGFGAAEVHVSDDVASAMLAKDTSAYHAYTSYLETFPSDAIAIISVQNAVCKKNGWQLLVTFSDSLDQLESSYKVSSVASRRTKLISSTVDDIRYDDVRDTPFASPDLRCEAIKAFSPFKNKLIVDNNSVALLVVPEKNVSANTFAADVIKVTQEFSPRFSDIGARVVIAGDPIMSTAISDTMTSDLAFVLLLLLAMIVVSGVLTKSLSVCLAVLATSSFSLLGSFGTMGLLGKGITPGSALAVFILVPLSAAFVIHAYAYRVRYSESIVPQESIGPLIIAGATTAALFGLTAITPSPDVRSLAMVGSVGIILATVAVFIVAFPIFSLSSKQPYLPHIVVPRWIYLRSTLAFSALFAMILVCAVGLSNIKFEYNAINYLEKSHPARIAYEEVGKDFGRMTIPLVVETDEANNPELWRDLNKSIGKINNRYGSSLQVSWLYDPIAELTKALSNDEHSFPHDQASFDQVLLFFSPEDTESFLSPDLQLITILLNIPFDSSAEYFKLKKIVHEELDSFGINGRLVGRVSGFFETGHRVGMDNLRSLAIGALLITALLVFVFRSLVLALMVLLANALPAILSVSVLSLMGVPIDLGSSIVTAMAFGIIVDDSTHLVVRIRQLQQSGYDPLTAVNRALGDLSAPIILTSLTLSIGFCSLFFAELIPFHDFAMTILIALSSALIADLVLLPTLVRTFIRDPLS